VLLAAVSGGLPHYLRDRGSAVTEIQAVITFNLRPLDEPVPRTLGNKQWSPSAGRRDVRRAPARQLTDSIPGAPEDYARRSRRSMPAIPIAIRSRVSMPRTINPAMETPWVSGSCAA
jgi:hypothetical protein